MAKKAADDKRRQVVGMQGTGLIVLAIGLGFVHFWLGLVAFGLGVILMGIGQELSA